MSKKKNRKSRSKTKKRIKQKRPPKPPSAPSPVSLIEQLLADFRKAGVEVAPQITHAMRRTGRVVTTSNRYKLTDADLAEWDAAINEYHVFNDLADAAESEGEHPAFVLAIRRSGLCIPDARHLDFEREDLDPRGRTRLWLEAIDQWIQDHPIEQEAVARRAADAIAQAVDEAEARREAARQKEPVIMLEFERLAAEARQQGEHPGVVYVLSRTGLAYPRSGEFYIINGAVETIAGTLTAKWFDELDAWMDVHPDQATSLHARIGEIYRTVEEEPS